MNNIQKIALMYVVIMLVLTYGYVIGRFQVFPYHALESLAQDFEAFSAGDQLENKTSVFEKLQNDLGFSADRVLYSYPELAVEVIAKFVCEDEVPRKKLEDIVKRSCAAFRVEDVTPVVKKGGHYILVRILFSPLRL